MQQIHQFYMSMMALRRNPYRKCKIEETPTPTAQIYTNAWTGGFVEEKVTLLERAEEVQITQ
jgi:hypothetical protein